MSKSKSKMARFEFKQTATTGRAVGLYIRVSSKEFKKDEAGDLQRRQSVKTQISDAIADAKSYGWTDYKIYDADNDVSGSEELIDRPALQQLKKDIEAGKIHTVIVRELDRIFRNADLQSFFRNKVFLPNGVDLKITSDKSFSWWSQSGNLISTIKGIQNEDFLRDLSRRIIRNKTSKAEEGTLRTPPAFGYGVVEADGVRRCVVKEAEALVVKEIFDRTIKGEGLKQIKTDLSLRGIRSKKGKCLDVSNLNKIIRNTIYKGVLIYNDKPHSTPYPPIVSADVWERAQMPSEASAIAKGRHTKAMRTRGTASNSHLLSGILQCGYCVDKLGKLAELADEAGEDKQDTTHHIYKNYVYSQNTTHNQYRCQTKFKNYADSCPNSIAIKASHIEDVVVKLVKELIEADVANNHDKHNDKLSQVKLMVNQAEEKLRKLSARQKDVKKKYASLEIDENDYDDLMQGIKSNIVKTEETLSSLISQQKILSGTATGEALAQLGKWDSLSPTEQKNGLMKIFDRILVYDDCIKVFLKIAPVFPFCFSIKYLFHQGNVINTDSAYTDVVADGQKVRMSFDGRGTVSFTDLFKAMISK